MAKRTFRTFRERTKLVQSRPTSRSSGSTMTRTAAKVTARRTARRK